MISGLGNSNYSMYSLRGNQASNNKLGFGMEPTPKRAISTLKTIEQVQKRDYAHDWHSHKIIDYVSGYKKSWAGLGEVAKENIADLFVATRKIIRDKKIVMDGRIKTFKDPVLGDLWTHENNFDAADEITQRILSNASDPEVPEETKNAYRKYVASLFEEE